MRTIRNCGVAVTGGAGFLGSHAVDHLIEDRGCSVLVLDNLCAGRREFVHPKAIFEYCDITDSEIYLLNLFKKYEVEYVFSYAAHPYVPNSFERPVHVCNVNFMGALHVINAAQEAGCKGILQVSSAEIYGGDGRVMGEFGEDVTPGLTPIDRPRTNHFAGPGMIGEEYPIEPHSSYGVSKAAVDAFVQVAWRERRTPCIALRQFNCLGERDILHPYVVPAIIEQLVPQLIPVDSEKAHCSLCGYPMLESENMFKFHGYSETCEQAKARVPQRPVPTVRLGNNTFRDFLDAEDAVKMAVELLENGQFGSVYNSGSQQGIKMYDLAKLVGKVMGFSDVVVEPDPSRMRPWDIQHLQSDNTKLYSVITHRPQVPLEESIRRMVEWYKEHVR